MLNISRERQKNRMKTVTVIIDLKEWSKAQFIMSISVCNYTTDYKDQMTMKQEFDLLRTSMYTVVRFC